MIKICDIIVQVGKTEIENIEMMGDKTTVYNSN